jgi:signal transduction histidine kinase
MTLNCALRSACSTVARALQGAALLLLTLLTLLAAPSWAQPIRAIEWTPVGPGQVPAAEARWTRLPLPARWYISDPPLQGGSLRMEFAVPTSPPTQWAVLLTQLPAGGRIAVNSHVLRTVPSADADHRVHWQRPFLLPLPAVVLQPGVNTLTIETMHAAGAQSVGAVEVGPLHELLDTYDVRFFFAYTALWIAVALALPIALFFGLLLRRPDRLFALLTMAALFWLGHAGSLLLEGQAALLQPWVTTFSTFCFGAFMIVVTLTLWQQSEQDRPRGTTLAWMYAAAGGVLPLAFPPGTAFVLMSLWQLGLAVFLGIGLLLALERSLRGQVAPHPILLLASALLVLATVHDVLLDAAFQIAIDVPLLNLAGPLVLVTLATPLVDRFFRALTEAESARTELETRVREREQLLKRNFERLRESERMQARVAERQRIMQDIHDGLGSQLLSALMLVERRALTNRQVAQVLRESIDDLRLAIDAIASDEPSLTGALGNLRYRLEPRLRAAGIALQWDSRGLPAEVDVDPATVLPLLRIVQEALTNTLKHSRATTVRVESRIDQVDGRRWLVLRVVDNGRGITEEGVRGRGLPNMRNRAARIGAEFALESAPDGGTVVQVRVALGATAAKSPEEPQTALNTRSVIEHLRRL